MKIEDAQKLKIGDRVCVPENRGDDYGEVTVAGTCVHKNIHGEEYIWISVRYTSGREQKEIVWPSNRVSKA